jgi:hypothetical protein
MFNRTYHVRAARQAINAEIAKGYYRPPTRPVPGADVPVLRGRHVRRIVGDAPDSQLTLPFPLTEAELAKEFEKFS